VVRAGQAHRFGPDGEWDGWVLLFRPEFLSPSAAHAERRLANVLDQLKEHLVLPPESLRAVVEAIRQMHSDAKLVAQRDEVHALLHSQLNALLLRLGILGKQLVPEATAPGPTSDRFEAFRELVERNHAKWHQVANYARQLKCSDKSLTRATAAVLGVSAKAYIASRVVLEAKRLLAHTAMTVTAISDRLGFDEPTNFVKFFRREAGITPVTFRSQHDMRT
jgi:AraC-like DNA-binding protein